MNAIGAKQRALWIVSAVLAAGCAATTSYRMRSFPAAPAASGIVEVSGGAHEDSHLSIHVDNLADPSTLAPGSSAYVVWVAPTDAAAAENVGSLQVDGHSGSLSTATALHDFVVSITPEIEAKAIAPSGPEILSVTVHR
jgi:hypothetical protein